MEQSLENNGNRYGVILGMQVPDFNLETRLSLDLPVSLVALDSTTMAVGENRLPWAPYHGKRSGVKMHPYFRVDTLLPIQVETSKGLTHDAPVANSFSYHLITSVSVNRRTVFGEKAWVTMTLIKWRLGQK
ncbi:hypothetical protein HUG20_05295 [Salicibibacter cibi]|uniref:Uncharacterized protein n=1 Tax=Salicibibacter cibi TaxID=2743001 RepID=A0A7T6Z9N7_9BACI|nr:hypothetical protein HUG20_05295 [Salicibibacter cibi]